MTRSTVQFDLLLSEFSDIFATYPNDVGFTNLDKHHIDTYRECSSHPTADMTCPANKEGRDQQPFTQHASE